MPRARVKFYRRRSRARISTWVTEDDGPLVIGRVYRGTRMAWLVIWGRGPRIVWLVIRDKLRCT